MPKASFTLALAFPERREPTLVAFWAADALTSLAVLFDGAVSVLSECTACADLTAAKDADIGCISKEGTTKEASGN